MALLALLFPLHPSSLGAATIIEKPPLSVVALECYREAANGTKTAITKAQYDALATGGLAVGEGAGCKNILATTTLSDNEYTAAGVNAASSSLIRIKIPLYQEGIIKRSELVNNQVTAAGLAQLTPL